MSATTLSLESQAFALEFRALLTEIDPARWRDEQEAALRERLSAYVQSLEALGDAMTSSADQRLDALRVRLAQVAELMSHHHQALTAQPAEPVTLAAAETPSNTEALREAWMTFRSAAVPAYEELAAALKAEDLAVPSLRPTNYTRNVFHVLSAAAAIAVVELLPRALPSLGAWSVVIAAGVFFTAGWSMEAGRRFSARINALLMRLFSKVAHPHEAHHINSSTWYVTALLALSLTLSPLTCTIALAVLGIGDPMAAVIGKRWGRTRFANGRSLEGTAAFAITGTLAALAAGTLAHPTTPLPALLTACAAAATTGALCELSLQRIDDNLGIPLSAGAAALVVLSLWGLV